MVPVIGSCSKDFGRLNTTLRGINFHKVELDWIIIGFNENGFQKIFTADDPRLCLRIRQSLLKAVGPLGPWDKWVAIIPAGILRLIDLQSGKEWEIGVTQIGFFLDNASTLGKAFTCKPLASIIEEIIGQSKLKNRLYVPEGLFQGLSGKKVEEF